MEARKKAIQERYKNQSISNSNMELNETLSIHQSVYDRAPPAINKKTGVLKEAKSVSPRPGSKRAITLSVKYPQKNVK